MSIRLSPTQMGPGATCLPVTRSSIPWNLGTRMRRPSEDQAGYSGLGVPTGCTRGREIVGNRSEIVGSGRERVGSGRSVGSRGGRVGNGRNVGNSGGSVGSRGGSVAGGRFVAVGGGAVGVPIVLGVLVGKNDGVGDGGSDEGMSSSRC